MDHQHLSAPENAPSSDDRRLVAAGYVRRAPSHHPVTGELDVAIRVGRRMLAHYGTVDSGNIFDYAEAHGGLAEALRILLLALDVEAGEGQ
jgi:hypothetical protein